MGVLGTALKLIFLGIALLVTVMLIRTLTFPSQQPNVGKCSPEDSDFIKLTDEMTKHFQEAIRIKTIAWSNTDIMLSGILDMHTLLERGKFFDKLLKICCLSNDSVQSMVIPEVW